MTIDVKGLNDNLLKTAQTYDEFAKKLRDFMIAPAGDITYEYYDNQGNLQSVLVPNRNKIVNDFIANVNSAMSKIFYVDQINGNDNNDGSQAYPFKTIQKAVDSAPVGGLCRIILLSDITIDSNIIALRRGVVIDAGSVNKAINVSAINISDSNGVFVGTGFPKIVLLGSGSFIHFYNCSVNLPNISSTGNGNQWLWEASRAFIQCGSPDNYIGFYSVGFSHCNLNVGDNAFVVSGIHGTNVYPADSYIYAGRFATTTNLNGFTTNGFATSDVQIIE